MAAGKAGRRCRQKPSTRQKIHPGRTAERCYIRCKAQKPSRNGSSSNPGRQAAGAAGRENAAVRKRQVIQQNYSIETAERCR